MDSSVQVDRRKDGLLVAQCPHCPWSTNPYKYPRQIDNSLAKHIKKEHT